MVETLQTFEIVFYCRLTNSHRSVYMAAWILAATQARTFHDLALVLHVVVGDAHVAQIV